MQVRAVILAVALGVAVFYLQGLVDYAWHRWFSHHRLFWFTHESHHLPTQIFVGMPGLGVRPFAVLTVVPVVAFTAALTYAVLRLAGLPMWSWTIFQLPLLLSSTLLVTSHSSFMRRGWLAHRLSLGVTEGVAELGQDKTLWLEANAAELNGVSFAKGCYVGQENTARMHYRAKVNRRLVVAPIAPAGDRTRAAYPDLGLMVELRRVEALGDAIMPEWLAAAL